MLRKILNSMSLIDIVIKSYFNHTCKKCFNHFFLNTKEMEMISSTLIHYLKSKHLLIYNLLR
jgi:hypothetical protein